MNDTPWTSDASTPKLPPATPFQPGASELSPELRALGGGTEPVVLLLGASHDLAWAADSAVAIAATLAGAGRRVVLADLHLEEPILHERLGEANTDGIVDIFLYGASVSRSAKPARDHGFFFIPGGTYAPDTAEVYAHPRWEKLVAGFRDARATLLAFAPAGANGWEHLVRLADEVVVLGEPSDEVSASLATVMVRSVLVADQPEPEVRVVEAPAEAEPFRGGSGGGAAEAAPAAAEMAPAEEVNVEPVEPIVEDAGVAERAEDLEPAAEWDGTDPERESYAAWSPGGEPDRRPYPARDGWDWDDRAGAESGDVDPFRDRTPGGEPVPAPPVDADPLVIRVEPREAEEPVRAEVVAARYEPADEERDFVPPRSVVGSRRRGRGSGPSVLVWLLVAVVVIAAAVVIAAVVRPDLFGGTLGFGAAATPADTAEVSGVVPPPPEPPVAQGSELPWVVQVQSFQRYEAAHSQAERQSRRVPEVPVYVVPETTQGVLYYKIMAGALPDTLAARTLRGRLVEAGVVGAEFARDDAPGTWSLIQARPLAFSLGEFASREEALAQVDSLAARRIPAYPLGIPYSDGTERWRLYAGAFPDTIQAEDLRQLLRTAELPTRLVTRVGQPSLPTP